MSDGEAFVPCPHGDIRPRGACPCAFGCHCYGRICRPRGNYPGDSLKTEVYPSSQYWLASGRVVDVLNPTPDDIAFDDIVNGLSRVQRFGGQINAEHYSVAEHCVLVSYLCCPRNAILGLLHDASEAYIGDVVTPLKRQIPIYYQIEERWMLAIGAAAGLGERLAHLPIDVKIADLRALQTERRDLYSPPRRDESMILPSPRRLQKLGPARAAKLFRKRFAELTSGRPWGA